MKLAAKRLAFTTAAASLLALSACSDSGTTSGTRVELEVKADATPRKLTNGYGYEVSVNKVEVSFGEMYFYDGPAIYAQRSPAEKLWQLVEKSAFAHPGHYGVGNALAELLRNQKVELGETPLSLGVAKGVSGEYKSASFALKPLEGSRLIHVEGTAQKDGQTHFFQADIDATSLALDKNVVAGCPLGPVGIEANGTLNLHVALDVWFDRVDFSDVAAGTADAPTTLDDTTTGGRGFQRGIRKAGSYQFSYQP